MIRPSRILIVDDEASGPVTNLAAWLAATAKAGQLLVGPETVR